MKHFYSSFGFDNLTIICAIAFWAGFIGGRFFSLPMLLVASIIVAMITCSSFFGSDGDSLVALAKVIAVLTFLQLGYIVSALFPNCLGRG